MTVPWRPHDLEPSSMLDDDFEFWDVSDEVYNAIRAAELAAEGAALRASARAALMHRVALALLGVSLLLSLAMLLLPVLRPWYGQAPWVLIWGVLAYFVIAAIAYWSRPRTSAPELRRLRRIRQGIASLLRDLQTARGSRQDPVLIRALTDAIDLLDEQLIPALQELVQRRSNLEKQLARYERGQLPSPDPDVLARLQEIYRRQQAAIVDCERQAANAHATLVALLQEGDDGSIALRARSWADGLATLYDSLNEVLHGTDDATRSDTGGARQEPERPGPAATSPVPGNRPNDVDVVYVRQVEGALIALHDLGKLSVCELMSQIPLTIAAICKDRRNGHGGYPTSLEQAQALSDVLRAAVERLSPGDAPEDRHTSDRVLAAQVLADRYLRGLSPRQIMSRRNISESTVHRYRREGIRVVARELHEQEALYERDKPGPSVP